MKTLISIIAVTLLLPLIQGCAPVVVGGAATGVTVIHDRRSAGTSLDDQTIELKALVNLTNDPAMKADSKLSATSYNYVVLLTGQAATAAQRDSYARMASLIPKVKRVVNEVQVGPVVSLSQRSTDAWITSKAKVELFDIKLPDFDPSRVKVLTENGVVYLMGMVTPQEENAVVEKVRYLRGVKQVVKVFENI